MYEGRQSKMGAKYFYSIAGEPVFVSLERSRQLAEQVLSGKDFQWRSKVDLRDGRERREAAEMEARYLTELHKRDKAAFERDWIRFELSGQEAQDNLFRLIDAFVSAHGLQERLLFRDIRGYGGGLRGELMREEAYDDRWPFGKTYHLLHFSKRWWGKTSRMEIEVDTQDVVRAVGRLRAFTVFGQSLTIDFDPNAVVIRRTVSVD